MIFENMKYILLGFLLFFFGCSLFEKAKKTTPDPETKTVYIEVPGESNNCDSALKALNKMLLAEINDIYKENERLQALFGAKDETIRELLKNRKNVKIKVKHIKVKDMDMINMLQNTIDSLTQVIFNNKKNGSPEIKDKSKVKNTVKDSSGNKYKIDGFIIWLVILSLFLIYVFYWYLRNNKKNKESE